MIVCRASNHKVGVTVVNCLWSYTIRIEDELVIVAIYVPDYLRFNKKLSLIHYASLWLTGTIKGFVLRECCLTIFTSNSHIDACVMGCENSTSKLIY